MRNLLQEKKIFLGLVNYGTQAGLLAKGLRNKGISAISISAYDPYKRQIDITLKSGRSFLVRVFYFFVNRILLLKLFIRYDIFHFYYGSTLLPKQKDLKYYKFFNKKVIFHYLGNDVQLYKESTQNYKWTNMPGFIGDRDPDEYDRKISERLRYETFYADKQLVCAPLYSEFVPESIVLPLAIDTNEYTYTAHPKNKIPILLHAPTNRGFKGTSYIEDAAKKLLDEGYCFHLKIITNITHAELKEEYKKCDIFIDQLMAGWYGTASIEAMAIGRPVICSIRESYFEHIDYGHNIPIIHADPDNIYEVIKKLLDNKDILADIGKKSRIFVEEIHELKKVTEQLIPIYESLL